MSLWPIIVAICNQCGKRVSVFDYDLQPGDDTQQKFLDLLARDGWKIPWTAEEIEADDDCAVYPLCPEHIEDKEKYEPVPRLDNFGSNDQEGLNKRYWARRGVEWPFEKFAR